MEWLKILIFNSLSVKLLVKCPTKKIRISHFTTDARILRTFFSLCKKHQNPFLSFSFLLSSTPSLLLQAKVCFLLFFYFLFSVFLLINIFYEFFFFYLFSFTRNYIKVRFFSSFFCIIFFYLIFNFLSS
jgi:hypothetical protein